MSVDQGFGASITFDSGFFANILSISHRGITREAVPTTHSGTTNGFKTFTPSDLIDWGELDVRIQFNKNSRPPIDDAAETCTVTFPLAAGESSAATWAATAFMTNFEYTNETISDELMEATCTLKFSADVTVTASS